MSETRRVLTEEGSSKEVPYTPTTTGISVRTPKVETTKKKPNTSPTVAATKTKTSETTTDAATEEMMKGNIPKGKDTDFQKWGLKELKILARGRGIQFNKNARMEKMIELLTTKGPLITDVSVEL